MKPQLFLNAALMVLLCAVQAKGQPVATDAIPAKPSRPYGRFNYTYLRLAYFVPLSGFNNPMQAGFSGSGNFSMASDLHNSFCLGLESGKVRHFNKLDLGTQMLKLGINSGIAFQGFGSGEKKQGNVSAYTDGTYLVRLGLGPQLSFKPMEDLRIGFFYRAGIALVYSSYVNEQRTETGPDAMHTEKVDMHFLHRAYNGDLGIDCSWRALCFGITYSTTKGRPSKASLVDPSSLGDEYNTYYTSNRSGVIEQDKVIIPIDPVIKWNRIGFSLGFAF